MRTINLKDLNETLYYEELDNGLKVYILPNLNKKNIYATFTTSFGGKDNKYFIDKKEYSLPKGIAHFLEHKLFEQEDGSDAFSLFSKSGTNSNAFTSSERTTYEFDGPENFIENINYLLDFVQKPYFTDENVEKEKGIIEQEIDMGLDNPDIVLYYMSLKNILNSNSFRESVIGSKESINSITKEMLQECYETFYHPSNMHIVITGNVDYKQAFEEIRKNIKYKVFKSKTEFIRDSNIDEDSVINKYEEKQMSIELPKINYCVKIKKLKEYKIEEYDIYINMISHILFGPTSLINKLLIDSKIIKHNLSNYILDVDSHYILFIESETNKLDDFVDTIDNYVKGININKDDFNRCKKVFKSSNIIMLDNIYSTNYYISNSELKYSEARFNNIKIINDSKIEIFNDILNKIDFNNKSVNVIKPIEKADI